MPFQQARKAMNVDQNQGITGVEEAEPQSQAQDVALSDTDGVTRFIEQMGMSAQADGVPRIAGRIFGYFVINGGPISFTQLAQELQVSRASVSTNLRILASIGF